MELIWDSRRPHVHRDCSGFHFASRMHMTAVIMVVVVVVVVVVVSLHDAAAL